MNSGATFQKTNEITIGPLLTLLAMDRFQRSGAWSKEEERFATAIIEAFHSGRLDFNEGKARYR